MNEQFFRRAQDDLVIERSVIGGLISPTSDQTHLAMKSFNRPSKYQKAKGPPWRRASLVIQTN